MVREGELLWTPRPEWIAETNLVALLHWLERERGLKFADYHALWRWSVDHLEDFWAALWDYFAIDASVPYQRVLGRREMPGAEWFPGARLNYAQHAMRQERPDATALLFASETTPLSTMPWSKLAGDVRVLATHLRAMGVRPGDRIAGFLTNCPEAVISVLATASVGAIWSGCSPDFGSRSVLDRFAQIEPRVLICVDGYRYGGKSFDRREEVRNIAQALPTLEHVIFLPYLDRGNETPPVEGALLWREVLAGPPVAAKDFLFEQVPFDHPLWILYSSGTTGLPKAIVQGHGGTTLEQMKLTTFHMNMKPGDCMFFFTTTGWMMWNFLVSSLLAGVRPLLYDGNPAYPAPDALWVLAEQAGAKLFGASPTYQQMLEKFGVVPREKFDLSKLEALVLAGSPVSAECMAWFYDNVKRDLWVCPGSGGTDVCSGFVGGTPLLPVYAGEIQAPHLGVDAQAFNERGESVIDEVGELVIAQPMPSMPLRFWNDPGDQRYRETYFADFPGIWRHGDYFKINDRDGCFVLGRSDATLNRYGVRIGTAEIYRSVESLEEVESSLIVNLDLPGGRFFMPLFVKPAAGVVLDDALRDKIRAKLRTDYSPRHVPDQIYAVSDIPCTLTGKKMEIPVRKILLGFELEKAANPSAMANPQSLDWFIDFARNSRDYSLQ
jgi:acetoacetyl-CoA synthetase